MDSLIVANILAFIGVTLFLIIIDTRSGFKAAK
jgi:hypothetical protein